MCLISYCPPGTIKYNDEVEAFVEAGFQSNIHGSGIMWKRKNEENLLHIKKGFYNLSDLLSFIKNLDLKEEDELAIHHRIGTQGANNAANTHPFIISDNHEICISEEGSFNLPALMHNGIFHHIEQHEKEGYSDTYAFANGVISQPVLLALLKAYPKRFDKALSDIIAYNRLCIMFPDREAVLFGNFIENNGYYHSNSGYYDWSYRNKGGKESYVGSKKTKTTTKNTSAKSTTNKIGYALHSSLVIDSETEVNENEGLKHVKQLGKGFERDNFKPIIKLDDVQIDITKDNCTHFIYLLKDGCKVMSGIKIGQPYKVTSYDSIQGLCCLYTPDNEKLLYTIKTAELKTCFYYHPMTLHKRIYDDYVTLNQKLEPTKSNLKKLSAQLSSKWNKGQDDSFIVKKLGLPFCKRAIELYVNKHWNKFFKEKKTLVYNQESREFAFHEAKNFTE